MHSVHLLKRVHPLMLHHISILITVIAFIIETSEEYIERVIRVHIQEQVIYCTMLHKRKPHFFVQ
jgi:hypothetical protein